MFVVVVTAERDEVVVTSRDTTSAGYDAVDSSTVCGVIDKTVYGRMLCTMFTATQSTSAEGRN